MGVISVEGIKVYAYHGCLPEEGLIGGDYIVDVYLKANLKKAAHTDDLAETIDYVTVYRIVKEEMAIRSKLIEHVGNRILDRLKAEFQQLEKTEVRVTKINPPMNGYVEKVSFLIKD